MKNSVITINNRNIRYETKSININELDYYKENPRINYIISKLPENEVTAEAIQSVLLKKEYTRELIQDILDNGGLLEPILVVGTEVIEGNTRLCAYRRIYEKTQDKKWLYIKANVISEPVDRKEIFTILSNYHIKGKSSWDAYEKAACIQKMVDEGQSILEVAKLVRSTPKKVQTSLKAYNIMREKYLKQIEDEDNLIFDVETEHLKKYSYFEAFFGDSNLVKTYETTPHFIDEFVDWVKEGRIPKAQDVRELNNILSNKKARRRFQELDPENAFNDARVILYWEKPDKIEPFYKKIGLFRETLRDVEINIIKDEINENPKRKQIIGLCFKDFKKFCRELGIK